MTNIYVIRHAEAEGNIFRRIHGHYNSRITANGDRQIAALQKRFATIPIDAVYASDLYRTSRTAQSIYLPKGLPLYKDSRFREVGFGRWEDSPFGHLAHFEPELLYQFNNTPQTLVVEGAELYSQYTARFVNALREAAEENDGKTIAVFTHGCISDNSFRLMFGDAARKAGRCDNTGVSLLHYENGSFTYSFFYDNSHLSDEISTFAHQRWWRGKQDFNVWFRPAAKEDASFYDPGFLPPENHETFIALLNDTPVGYVSAQLHGSNPTISCIWLTENHRYERMGDQLLGCAVSAARRNGAKTLTVGVPSQQTPMLAFLTRHGAQIAQMDDLFTVFTLQIVVPVIE